jgi:hypothetical protein
VNGIPASTVLPALEGAGNLIVHLCEGGVVDLDPLKPLVEPVFVIRAIADAPRQCIYTLCLLNLVSWQGSASFSVDLYVCIGGPSHTLRRCQDHNLLGKRVMKGMMMMMMIMIIMTKIAMIIMIDNDDDDNNDDNDEDDEDSNDYND